MAVAEGNRSLGEGQGTPEDMSHPLDSTQESQAALSPARVKDSACLCPNHEKAEDQAQDSVLKTEECHGILSPSPSAARLL